MSLREQVGEKGIVTAEGMCHHFLCCWPCTWKSQNSLSVWPWWLRLVIPAFGKLGRIARLVKEEKEGRRGVGKERGEQERKEGEELLFMSQGGPWVWTFLLFTNQTDSKTHRRDTVMCTAQESPSQAHQETTFWGPWPSGGQLSQCWKVDVGCRRGMWGCWCGVGL